MVVVLGGWVDVVVVGWVVVVLEAGGLDDVVVDPWRAVVVVEPDRTVEPVPLEMSATRPDTSSGRS